MDGSYRIHATRSVRSVRILASMELRLLFHLRQELIGCWWLLGDFVSAEILSRKLDLVDNPEHHSMMLGYR